LFKVVVVLGNAIVKHRQVIQKISDTAGGPERQVFHRNTRTTTYRIGLLWQDHTKFGHQAADAIDGRRALLHEPLPNPMDGKHALGVFGFDGNKAHRRPAHRFANRSSIIGVILAAFALHAIGGNELRCHESGRMAQLDELACPVMGSRTSLHADQAGRKLREQLEQLLAAHSGPYQHRFADSIDTMHCNYILGQVNADDGNCIQTGILGNNSGNLAHDFPSR